MSLTEDYIEKRKQAINKFVQAEIRKQLQPVINQLLREPVESTNWRLGRAIRRIIRRDILRDCRRRHRIWRKTKRLWTKALRYAESTPFAAHVLVGVCGMPTLMHPDRIATVRVDE